MVANKDALSQSVYLYLADQIMSGALKPGEKVSEAAVAESYGISRTPVRDAMRRLDNEGIMQIFPKRFAQVSAYTEDDVREVGYMRLTLDQMAVRLAMRFGNMSDFDALEQVADDCLKAYRSGDRMRRTALDAQFHMQLAEIARNSLLLKFQAEINVRVQFILTYYRTDWVNEESHLYQHNELVACLRGHDLERGLQLVSDHLVKFYGL